MYVHLIGCEFDHMTNSKVFHTVLERPHGYNMEAAVSVKSKFLTPQFRIPHFPRIVCTCITVVISFPSVEKDRSERRTDSKVMALSLSLLFFCALSMVSIDETLTCKSSSCSYRTCTNRYSGYSPSPSQGRCVWQINRVSHDYQTYSRSSGCPGDSSCNGGNLQRYLCMNFFRYLHPKLKILFKCTNSMCFFLIWKRETRLTGILDGLE